MLESIREAHKDQATTGHIQPVNDAKLVHLSHGLEGLETPDPKPEVWN